MRNIGLIAFGAALLCFALFLRQGSPVFYWLALLIAVGGVVFLVWQMLRED